MELKAYAKINLAIDVLGTRDDGYHEVKMIMQSVDLFDVIRFDKSKSGINLKCSSKNVPCDERNIVYKALKLIKENYKVQSGVNVEIIKNIPVAAGLAGGSSDAAAAIIAANRIWELDMTYEDMLSIAKKVGADVPFCLKGGTALAQGIGEVITQLPNLDGVNIVLAKPPISVSTKEVYSDLRLEDIIIRPDIESLLDAVKEKNITYIANNMVNVLETVTVRKHPVISEIKNIMLKFGALGSMMSGSGPTVFGIFQDNKDCEKCYNRLKDYISHVYIVKTTGMYQEA